MNPDKYRRLIEETARRIKTQKTVDLLRGTFPEQRAFLLDPARLKAAHCSRGAAKSYTAGIGIFQTALAFAGCSCFYVTKTHDMARNIMWGAVMKAIDRDFKLNTEFNETLLEGRLPNGSTFRLTGIDGDRKQQDKLLGGKYKLVILDEVAFFETDLTEIIYKTLIPAIGRIDGSIWMMSTSSDYPRGLFYEVSRPEKEVRAKGWSLHEWQWWANPYVKDALEKVRLELIEANPLIAETNHYKQHWLNQWVIDEEKLCYRFNPARNLIKAETPQFPNLSPMGWSRVLGVDTGWEDDNAFVLTAYHENDPNLYVLKTHAQKRMTFDQVTAKIEEFMADPILAPHRIIIDGANKQGVESMRLRSNIPFEYADKLDKASFIEICNGDLVQGKIKVLDIPDNRGLCHEFVTLVWAVDGDKIKYPKKENPTIPNHRCDAFLYAWRMGYHYHAVAAKKTVVKYTPEWYAQQSENVWEQEREKLIAASQGGDWPEQGDWPEDMK